MPSTAKSSSSSGGSPKKQQHGHHHHHRRVSGGHEERRKSADEGRERRSRREGASDEAEEAAQSYPLHECVFRGDLAALSAHIRRLKAECASSSSAGAAAAATFRDEAAAGVGARFNPSPTSPAGTGLPEALAQRDHHGNTALHLAVMLGRREMVHLLLAHGAPVKVKNKLGWSPLAEAIR